MRKNDIVRSEVIKLINTDYADLVSKIFWHP